MMQKIALFSWLLVGLTHVNGLSCSTVTNPYREDGFGAQFQSIIYAAMYAELHDMKFVYTPFQKMEHNYNNDPDFLQKKETLINFIGHFDLNPKMSSHKIQEADVIQKYQIFFDTNIQKCADCEILKKIKTAFKENKKKSDFFDTNTLNIAIHIRRPNAHDCRLLGSDIPDKIYQQIIAGLRQKYNTTALHIHIYSQGAMDLFTSAYGASDVTIHLNESVEQTFSSLVFADVLVTSASSLSYIAGFLSEGEVFYIPFWHPPLPSWNLLQTDWCHTNLLCEFVKP